MSYFINHFEQNAQAFPDRIAVKFEDSEANLSYHELNQRANRLANYWLENKQLQPHQCVAIYHERALDSLVAILAAWKIGAAFILLDPKGNDSVQAILDVVAPDLIATTQSCQGEFSQPCHLFDDTVTAAGIASSSEQNPDRQSLGVTPDPVAYYIATSGTTGRRKVMKIHHTEAPDSGLEALFDDIGETMGVSEADTVLWDAPLQFDPIIFLFGMALRRGAALYIPNRGECEDKRRLIANCVSQQVNVMLSIPTLLEKLLQEYQDELAQIKSLKFISTGEKLPLRLANLVALIAAICNGFGESETPIGTLLAKHALGLLGINIGVPIRGRTIKILHPTTLQEVQPGEVGLLCVHCEGFGGYLNAEDKKSISIDGKKFYITNDLVQYSVEPQSSRIQVDAYQQPILQFLGRNDQQVKIAGVLINPASIQSALNNHIDIAEAKVMVHQPENNRLAEVLVFIKPKHGSHLTRQAVREYLASEVGRVIRHRFVFIEPDDDFNHYATRNGKFDGAALLARYGAEHAPETTQLLERVIHHWQDIFACDDIDGNSSFEALGGSSFDYITLCALIEGDSLIPIDNISSEFTYQFAQNKSVFQMLKLIQQHQNRKQLIQRHFIEKQCHPLIVLEAIQEELKHLKRPVYVVNYSQECEVADRAADVLKTLRENNVAEPYYFLIDDVQVAEQLTNKFRDEEVDFYIYCTKQSDWNDKINAQRVADIQASLQKKSMQLRRYHQHVAQSGNQLKLTPGANHVMLFGGANSGKTEKLRQYLVQLSQQVGHAVTLYLAATDGQFDLTETLENQGFTYDEIQQLKHWPIIIAIDNIYQLNDIDVVRRNIAQQGFLDVRGLFAINPGLVARSEFVQLFSDAQVQVVNLSNKWFFSDQDKIAEQLQAWIVGQVDKIIPHGTAVQKRTLFQCLLAYNIELATVMADGDGIIFKPIESIWENGFARTTARDRLFDSHDKLTRQALLSAPITLLHRQQWREVRFIQPAIKQWLQKQDKRLPKSFNPYIEIESNPLSDLPFKGISTLYHGEGSQAPLFVFPPLTGLNEYKALAEGFSVNQPVYTLQDPFWLSHRIRIDSMDDLAAYYVRYINSVYPEGEVNLIGWSFGSMVAIKVQEQFKKAGRQVCYLGIIDLPSPDYWRSYFQDSTNQWEYLLRWNDWFFQQFKVPDRDGLQRHLDTLPANNADNFNVVWQSLIHHIEANKEKIVQQHSADYYRYVHDLAQICHRNYQFVFECFTSTVSAENTFLYQATASDPFYPCMTLPQLGWQIAASQVVAIAGSTHFTITQEPRYASQLAMAIARHLQQTNQHQQGLLLDEKLRLYLQHTMTRLAPTLPDYYQPLDVKDGTDQVQAETTLWTQSDSHVLLTGEAGSGKSTALARQFKSRAQDYLRGNSAVLPLLIRLSDAPEDPVNAFLTVLSLTANQQALLWQKPLEIYIDGIDETLDLEQLLRSLCKLPLKSASCRVIMSCKSVYFMHNQRFRQFLQQQLAVSRFYLCPLNDVQIEQFLTNLTPDLCDSERQWLRNYIHVAKGQNASLTPLHLQMLISVSSDLVRRDTAQPFSFTRAELYSMDLASRARTAAVRLDTLQRFAIKLAITPKQMRKKSENHHPWDDSNTEFTHLLSCSRYDTDVLSQALGLQQTAVSKAFNHHSYKEFYTALHLFDEILQGRIGEGLLLNTLSLCYENDLLNFIADLYYMHVFVAHAENSEQARSSFCAILYRYFESARNNIHFSQLAANALSILARCQDFHLRLPTDYVQVYLRDVNLSYANLVNIDFSGVIACDAVLQGAELHGSTLPRHWQRTYGQEKVQGLQSIHALADGRMQGVVAQRTANSWKNEWSVIDLQKEQQQVFPVALNIPRVAEDDASDVVGKVALHPNGQYYAVYAKFSLSARYEGTGVAMRRPSTYALQIFAVDGSQLIRQYDLDDHVHDHFAIRGMGFHPEKPILCAFVNGTRRLLIFDFLHEGPMRLHIDHDSLVDHPSVFGIAGIDSKLEHFVFSLPLNCIVTHYEKRKNTPEERDCHTVKPENYDVGIALYSMSHFSEVSATRPSQWCETPDQVILIDTLTAGGGGIHTKIVQIATFSRLPYIVLATHDTQKIQHTALYIYDLQKQCLILTVELAMDKIISLQVSDDEKTIYFSDQRRLKSLHWREKKLTDLHLMSSSKQQLQICGTTVYLLAANYQLHTIALNDMPAIQRLPCPHSSQIRDIVYHPESAMMVTFDNVTTTCFWDMRTGKLLMQHHTKDAVRACFSRCGHYVFLVQKEWVQIVTARDLLVKAEIPTTLLGFIDYHWALAVWIDPMDEDYLMIQTTRDRDKSFIRWYWRDFNADNVSYLPLTVGLYQDNMSHNEEILPLPTRGQLIVGTNFSQIVKPSATEAEQSHFHRPKRHIVHPNLLTFERGDYARAVNQRAVYQVTSKTIGVNHELYFPDSGAVQSLENQEMLCYVSFLQALPQEAGFALILNRSDQVKIYSHTSELIQQLDCGEEVHTIHFSPNYPICLTTHKDCHIKFWRWQEEEPQCIFEWSYKGLFKRTAMQWINDDLLFFGTTTGDIFCFDLAPLVTNLEPPLLLWTTRYSADEQPRLISTPTFPSESTSQALMSAENTPFFASRRRQCPDSLGVRISATADDETLPAFKRI